VVQQWARRGIGGGYVSRSASDIMGAPGCCRDSAGTVAGVEVAAAEVPVPTVCLTAQPYYCPHWHRFNGEKNST